MIFLDFFIDFFVVLEGDVINDICYRRMYDFEFSVIIIDYFVWLVLIRERKVVVKGEVVIK